MNSERSLMANQRSFLTLFLGVFPTLGIGFLMGLLGSEIGPQRDLDPVSVFLRALVCSVPPAILALNRSRLWLYLLPIYCCGFYYGYTFGDSSDILNEVAAAAPYAFLFGVPLGTPLRPEHPELFWIFAFSLWLSAIVAFVRRCYLRRG
jgi:hypothetical protein